MFTKSRKRGLMHKRQNRYVLPLFLLCSNLKRTMSKEFVMDDVSFALPATARQLAYAQALASRNQTFLPRSVQQDRRALSAWIEAQAKDAPSFDHRPSSKQVAFAERIARAKRRSVPDECFRDRQLLSRWIDSNL